MHRKRINSKKGIENLAKQAEVAKPTANANSKKRAKNRKAGLAALLSGQQNQKSNPLSLASFMKK